MPDRGQFLCGQRSQLPHYPTLIQGTYLVYQCGAIDGQASRFNAQYWKKRALQMSASQGNYDKHRIGKRLNASGQARYHHRPAADLLVTGGKCRGRSAHSIWPMWKRVGGIKPFLWRAV